MKARIATVFATAVGALALATGALAAPHQGAVKGSDYMSPAATAGWTSYDAFAVKPNPWGSRGSLRPNPSGSRGSLRLLGYFCPRVEV